MGFERGRGGILANKIRGPPDPRLKAKKAVFRGKGDMDLEERHGSGCVVCFRGICEMLRLTRGLSNGVCVKTNLGGFLLLFL